MKKVRILIICLALLTVKSFGQDVSKVFDEVQKLTIRNIGAIKKNNVVKGYYSFYEYDKVDRKTLLFKLNLMDENLNDLGIKDIQGPKDWELVSSGFDGNNFCFKFYDKRTKTFELKVYDDQANEVINNVTKINYGANSQKAKFYNGLVSSELNVIRNRGFVDYTFNEPNDAFIISYADGNSKKTWQETYEPDGKAKIMVPGFLAGDSAMVLTAVTKVDKGYGNMDTQNGLIANNINTGALLFDVSTEFDDNHVVPINAVFQNDKIILIGLNYKTSKTYSRAPDGFAFLEMDRTGKLLKSNFKTFEETLGKFLPMEDHHLAGGYSLYVHNVVKTKNNTNLIIAEKFKKSADGMGIAMLAMGGSGSGNDGALKLLLQNMVLLEYDQQGNVLQAKEMPKGEGSTGVIPGSISQNAYLLASMANMYGLMDYMYTLSNDDRTQFTFNFLDRDRLNSDAKKTYNFGQIKYTSGVITEDKIPIKGDNNKKADFTHLYPAKPGYVLQANYYKKEKKLSMDFIKLNN